MLRLTFCKNVCMLSCRQKTSVLVSPFIGNHFTRVHGISTTTRVDGEERTASPARGMKMTISAIERQFPEVKTIKTDTLAQWMGEDNVGFSSSGAKDGKHSEQVKQSGINFVLLDVRLEEEAMVSKIPSSTRVDPDEKDMKKLEKIIKEKSSSKEQEGDPICVVMYCAVGYRASSLATRLQESLKKEGKQDTMNVYNVEGSIFKWANENRSLVNSAGEPTRFVHPYNTVFGSLYIDSSRRKFTP